MSSSTNVIEEAAPASPQVTINCDVTADLDSTNVFEGPEKLLEVWFAPTPEAIPTETTQSGLKSIPPDSLTEMLDLVNCKILSTIMSENVDCYLLSESSMFIWPHKLILKTCGTTTLLLGLRCLLRLAAAKAGFPATNTHDSALATPYRVFYSRKNFLFAQKQRGPHRSWRDEVKFLDQMFPNGSAYMVGRMNSDHWYLYITKPDMSAVQPYQNETQFLQTPAISSDITTGEDETLEILMTDLEPNTAKQFYVDHALACAHQQFPHLATVARKEADENLGDLAGSMTESTISTSTISSDNSAVFTNAPSPAEITSPTESEVEFSHEEIVEGHALGTVISETCGLSSIYPTSKYPGAKIDAYAFKPCGFSANGVIPASAGSCDGGHYFTVHVTPEPHCSFASFETNVPGCQTGRQTIDVINDVVNIFKPGRFSVTLFEAKPDHQSTSSSTTRLDPSEVMRGSGIPRSAQMERIPGYRRIDRIVHDFDGYDFVFRYYEREGWKGGGPRLGDIDL